jgi:uncharacterized membrane protein
MGNFKKYIIVGLITAIPIGLTVVIFKFLLGIIQHTVSPLISVIVSQVTNLWPGLGYWLGKSWMETIISVVCVLVILYFLGFISSRYAGQKILALLDSMMHRIPLVKSVYGSIKKLMDALQQSPGGTQRVVLIEFPSDRMKTVGLVTKTFKDSVTGRELAAVYVPTTPNPTSGYLEIVPVEHITPTDWTFDEAMTFIVSGGAVAPPNMHYD